MIIKVKELCLVDNYNNDNKELGEVSTRTIIYESIKETLLEAFKDYQENFNSDNIISAYADFDGECMATLEYLSVEKA